MVLFVKKLVSKKKKRITEKVNNRQYNLDLSYITDDIIAMGYPSSRFEKYYRNARREVKTYLDTKHGSSYKLWNLCAEKHYPERKFDQRVCHDFQFYDHESPPWKLIIPCCRSLQQFLNAGAAVAESSTPGGSDAIVATATANGTPSSPSSAQKNVVVVHCKAGKGRTGVIIASFLIYDRRVKNSQEALAFYASQRTKNGKGVTIPSQQRYVHYVGKWMELGGTEPHPNQKLRLSRIRFRSPLTSMTLSFKCLNQDRKVIYENPAAQALTSDPTAQYVEFTCDVLMSDDVKLVVTKKDGSKFKNLFHSWFNIEFIENGYVKFEKSTIDKCHKDKEHKKYPEDMALELFFKTENGAEIKRREGPQQLS